LTKFIFHIYNPIIRCENTPSALVWGRESRGGGLGGRPWGSDRRRRPGEAMTSERLKKLIDDLDQAGYVLKKYKRLPGIAGGGWSLVIDEKPKTTKEDD
jgi:hypothetical protein